MAESPKIIDAGTDIACIGLWDAGSDREPFESSPAMRALETEARTGRVFFVQTGSDGSYATAIYVERDVPESALKFMTTADTEYLLKVPTGTLCCGGLEDYRARKKVITGPDDEFTVPPGDYRVRFHGLDVEKIEQAAEGGLAAFVGVEDYAYWKARNSSFACLAIATGFVAALALLFAGEPWYALGLVGVGLAAAWLNYMWRRRDPRYREIDERVAEYDGPSEDDLVEDRPVMILELRRVPGATDLVGGWVTVFG